MITLIKYLWDKHIGKKNNVDKSIMDNQEIHDVVIAFADLLEEKRLCQTIAVGKTDTAEIYKSDLSGSGIRFNVLGGHRIIIIREGNQ